MPSCLLVDSGPIIAWLSARDSHHVRAVAFFKVRREKLISTWSVATEVCHLVPRPARATFLRWIAAGGMSVWHVPEDQASSLADRMDKYDDLPMDLADASLVWLASEVGTNLIATTDRTDFGIYRSARNRPFRNVFFE